MIYLVLFLYIIIYFSIFERIKLKSSTFIFTFVPIGVLLIIVLGLQNNVGTDYFSYLELAEGTKSISYINGRAEYLFIKLILLVRFLNVPQLIFVFSAFIQVFFLMLITLEVKKLEYRVDCFFFLYFTLSLVFFNQFNGIRQYIAVYIIVYALFKLMEGKRLTYLFLVVISGLFHSSAYFFLAV